MVLLQRVVVLLVALVLVLSASLHVQAALPSEGQVCSPSSSPWTCTCSDDGKSLLKCEPADMGRPIEALVINAVDFPNVRVIGDGLTSLFAQTDVDGKQLQSIIIENHPGLREIESHALEGVTLSGSLHVRNCFGLSIVRPRFAQAATVSGMLTVAGLAITDIMPLTFADVTVHGDVLVDRNNNLLWIHRGAFATLHAGSITLSSNNAPRLTLAPDLFTKLAAHHRTAQASAINVIGNNALRRLSQRAFSDTVVGGSVTIRDNVNLEAIELNFAEGMLVSGDLVIQANGVASSPFNLPRLALAGMVVVGQVRLVGNDGLGGLLSGCFARLVAGSLVVRDHSAATLRVSEALFRTGTHAVTSIEHVEFRDNLGIATLPANVFSGLEASGTLVLRQKASTKPAISALVTDQLGTITAGDITIDLPAVHTIHARAFQRVTANSITIVTGADPSSDPAKPLGRIRRVGSGAGAIDEAAVACSQISSLQLLGTGLDLSSSDADCGSSVAGYSVSMEGTVLRTGDGSSAGSVPLYGAVCTALPSPDPTPIGECPEPNCGGVTCDDGNACTIDTCGGTVCISEDAENNTPCPDDGNSCSINRCFSGTCMALVRPDSSGEQCNDHGILTATAWGTCSMAGTCDGGCTPAPVDEQHNTHVRNVYTLNLAAAGPGFGRADTGLPIVPEMVYTEVAVRARSTLQVDVAKAPDDRTQGPVACSQALPIEEVSRDLTSCARDFASPLFTWNDLRDPNKQCAPLEDFDVTDNRYTARFEVRETIVDEFLASSTAITVDSTSSPDANQFRHSTLRRPFVMSLPAWAAPRDAAALSTGGSGTSTALGPAVFSASIVSRTWSFAAPCAPSLWQPTTRRTLRRWVAKRLQAGVPLDAAIGLQFEATEGSGGEGTTITASASVPASRYSALVAWVEASMSHEGFLEGFDSIGPGWRPIDCTGAMDTTSHIEGGVTVASVPTDDDAAAHYSGDAPAETPGGEPEAGPEPELEVQTESESEEEQPLVATTVTTTAVAWSLHGSGVDDATVLQEWEDLDEGEQVATTFRVRAELAPPHALILGNGGRVTARPLSTAAAADPAPPELTAWTVVDTCTPSRTTDGAVAVAATCSAEDAAAGRCTCYYEFMVAFPACVRSGEFELALDYECLEGGDHSCDSADLGKDRASITVALHVKEENTDPTACGAQLRLPSLGALTLQSATPGETGSGTVGNGGVVKTSHKVTLTTRAHAHDDPSAVVPSVVHAVTVQRGCTCDTCAGTLDPATSVALYEATPSDATAAAAIAVAVDLSIQSDGSGNSASMGVAGGSTQVAFDARAALYRTFHVASLDGATNDAEAAAAAAEAVRTGDVMCAKVQMHVLAGGAYKALQDYDKVKQQEVTGGTRRLRGRRDSEQQDLWLSVVGSDTLTVVSTATVVVPPQPSDGSTRDPNAQQNNGGVTGGDPNDDGDSNTTLYIIIIALAGVVAVFALAVALLVVVRRRRESHADRRGDLSSAEAGGPPTPRFKGKRGNKARRNQVLPHSFAAAKQQPPNSGGKRGLRRGGEGNSSNSSSGRMLLAPVTLAGDGSDAGGGRDYEFGGHGGAVRSWGWDGSGDSSFSGQGWGGNPWDRPGDSSNGVFFGASSWNRHPSPIPEGSHEESASEASSRRTSLASVARRDGVGPTPYRSGSTAAPNGDLVVVSRPVAGLELAALSPMASPSHAAEAAAAATPTELPPSTSSPSAKDDQGTRAATLTTNGEAAAMPVSRRRVPVGASLQPGGSNGSDEPLVPLPLEGPLTVLAASQRDPAAQRHSV